MSSVKIFYGFHKSGHYFVSRNLQQSLSKEFESAEIIDFWENSSHMLKELMNLFRVTNEDNLRSFPAFFKEESFLSKLSGEVILPEKIFEADLLVSTHPYTSYVLASLKPEHCKLVDVHTDYTPYPIFPHERIDIYTGAFPRNDLDLEVLPKLRSKGIPVPSVMFCTREGEDITVVGGSDGFGNVEETLELLLKGFPDRVINVVAGRNELLLDRLKKIKGVTAYGFIENMIDLYKKSGVVFTKASGVTCAELFASQTMPVLYPSSVPWEDEASIHLASRDLVHRMQNFSDLELLRIQERLSKSNPEISSNSYVMNCDDFYSIIMGDPDLAVPHAQKTRDFIYSKLLPSQPYWEDFSSLVEEKLKRWLSYE